MITSRGGWESVLLPSARDAAHAWWLAVWAGRPLLGRASTSGLARRGAATETAQSRVCGVLPPAARAAGRSSYNQRAGGRAVFEPCVLAAGVPTSPRRADCRTFCSLLGPQKGGGWRWRPFSHLQGCLLLTTFVGRRPGAGPAADPNDVLEAGHAPGMRKIAWPGVGSLHRDSRPLQPSAAGIACLMPQAR